MPAQNAQPASAAQKTELAAIAHLRLYPSLTNPSYLVLRSRRLLFSNWTRTLGNNLTVLDVGGRYQPYRPLLAPSRTLCSHRSDQDGVDQRTGRWRCLALRRCIIRPGPCDPGPRLHSRPEDGHPPDSPGAQTGRSISGKRTRLRARICRHRTVEVHADRFEDLAFAIFQGGNRSRTLQRGQRFPHSQSGRRCFCPLQSGAHRLSAHSLPDSQSPRPRIRNSAPDNERSVRRKLQHPRDEIDGDHWQKTLSLPTVGSCTPPRTRRPDRCPHGRHGPFSSFKCPISAFPL